MYDSIEMKRYADLLVRQGMNVQPGQLVNVAGEVIHLPLLRMVVEAAYLAGAKCVSIDIIDPISERLHLLHASDAGLRFVPQHFGARLNEIAETGGCSLRLVGMEDPRIYAGIDPAKVNLVASQKRGARSIFYDKGINKATAQWCVAAAATPSWAEQVFPELPADKAYEELWKTLFMLSRVDTDDYLERWRRHDEALHRRADTLNALKIETLRFTGGGSDLAVRLSEKAIFGGGTKTSAYGNSFTANLPTEEVFTTPDWRGTTGIARVTRPVLVNGVLVKDLVLEFENGEIKSFTASEGAGSFGSLIGTDVGAKRLGEVALVGIDSPVYRTGRVFQEILLDENACCHIAIGNAYKTKLIGGETMESPELDSLGCNSSAVHTDFMISSEKVSVDGVTYDGKTVALIKDGLWVI